MKIPARIKIELMLMFVHTKSRTIFSYAHRLQIMEPNIYATNTSCIEMDHNTVIYCEMQNIKVNLNDKKIATCT